MSTKLLRQTLVLTATVSATLLLGGCTLAPTYHAPPLPVVDQWPIPATTSETNSAATSAAASVATSDIGWREFFVDMQLQQLIEQALTNNRDLRVAVLNVERARAQYHIQRAELLPAINAAGVYNRQHLPSALTQGGPPAMYSYYEASLTMSAFEVDLFGRVRSLSRAALERYLAEEETRRSAQLSLIAEVANAYLSLAADRELQRLAQETLKSQQDSFELTSKRHDVGAVSALDMAQAQTTVDTAQVDAARYDGSVAQDLNALTLLVGGAINAESLPTQFDGTVTGLNALPAELPSTVLLRRPDVLSAEHQLRAANANIGAARAAFFPNISLTGSFGTASTELSNLFNSANRLWTFVPQITVPIFHGGALFANLDVAHSDHDIMLAQYEKAIQSAFRDVADGLALTTTLAREREAQESLAAATANAYDLSQQRYKSGRDSYLNLLDAQRSSYAAQQNLITIRRLEQSNRVTLYKALGGGWFEHNHNQ